MLASPEASKETRALIRNQLASGGILFPILRSLQIEAAGKSEALTRANFTTDEGVKAALKIQSEAAGLRRAIQIIFDLAEEEFTQ